jgi:TatD DNase family protein
MPGVAARMIDSHCHIDLEQFDGDRADVLQRARAAGVGAIVIPGIDLAQNRGALLLAEGDAGLFAAVGVHPNSADSFGDETIAALRDLAGRRKVVAIGEIGLDYYWDKVAPEQQRRAFVQQLGLGQNLACR